MIRAEKGIAWERHLTLEDLAYLRTRVAPDGWYPMATFERMGNAILDEIAYGDLEAVRMWGRFSVDQLHAANPPLIAAGDAIETLQRFRVLRSTFFDFDALEVLLLTHGKAEIAVGYHMGEVAEKAACYQTLGFFERLLALAGESQVDARFTARSWAGAPRTRLALDWGPGV
jgi:hypothetical protein